MIHARKDYNRLGPDPALEDPSLLTPGSTPIGELEPVCLFRAQDKNFIAVLAFYRMLINDDGTMDAGKKAEMVESINAHIRLTKSWNAAHDNKTPDL